MRDQESLPEDLLWQQDGHVSDVVLDTLADEQDEIVPVLARDHVSGCDVCTQRLGDAVVLALGVDDALKPMVESAATAAQTKSWPLPIPAMLAAVILAVLGTIPALKDLSFRLTELFYDIVGIIPNITRAAVLISRNGMGELGTQLAMLSLFSVAILLCSGFVIARRAPRQWHATGGAQ